MKSSINEILELRQMLEDEGIGKTCFYYANGLIEKISVETLQSIVSIKRVDIEKRESLLKISFYSWGIEFISEKELTAERALEWIKRGIK